MQYRSSAKRNRDDAEKDEEAVGVTLTVHALSAFCRSRFPHRTYTKMMIPARAVAFEISSEVFWGSPDIEI